MCYCSGKQDGNYKHAYEIFNGYLNLPVRKKQIICVAENAIDGCREFTDGEWFSTDQRVFERE
jgi:hypothetical protein